MLDIHTCISLSLSTHIYIYTHDSSMCISISISIRKRVYFGKGQMGSALMGSLQIPYFVQGLFGYSR